MRDRLIEWLGEVQECGMDRPRDDERYPTLYPRNEDIADHLLANGVIVPPIGLRHSCFDIRAKCVDECRVSSVTQKADGSLKIRITNLRYRAAYEITPDEIGKTVFLTREDCEVALAERSNENAE